MLRFQFDETVTVTHSRAHTVDFIQEGNNQTVEVSKIQHQDSKQKAYFSFEKLNIKKSN